MPTRTDLYKDVSNNPRDGNMTQKRVRVMKHATDKETNRQAS